MTNPKNHHFVPRMLLRQWANNDDQVRCWRWKDKKIEKFITSTKNIMAEGQLYKAQHIDNPSIYEESFAKIENDASDALKKLCSPLAVQLTDQDRIAWSSFILAQRARTPARIASTKQHARDFFINEFDKSDSEFDRLNVDGRFSTPAHYMNEHHPNVLANFHLHTTMKIIIDETNINAMKRLKWFVRQNFAQSLIISDDPVTLLGGLHEENCLIALPISPDKVFFAVSDEQIKDELLSENGESVAAGINEFQARQAQRFVIGDVDQEFLEKCLRKDP
jgi:hypothetical protein